MVESMIWLKITMAAVLSGSLFALVETVLPARPSQPFTVQVSDWPGDQLFALIEPLELLLPGEAFHLDIRRAAPGHDGLESFRAGLVDALLIDLARLPELIADEVRVIYAYDEVVGEGGLVAGPETTTAGALRGRTIGIAFGGAADSLTFRLLDRAGLTPQDVRIVALAPDSAATALRSGRVAAVAALSSSQLTELQRIPGAVLLASTQDIGVTATHVVVVREARIPDLRPRIESVIHAAATAVETCRAAMNRCFDLMATASGRPATGWRRDFEAVRWLDLKENSGLLAGGNEAPLARRLAQMTGRSKRGTSPPAMTWIDPSFLPTPPSERP